uniref:Uncharacterized protein n=1 Tax=Graphocephala atropunctata TaxID=36148 RepID=A0A1B6MVJ2_9HEMI
MERKKVDEEVDEENAADDHEELKEADSKEGEAYNKTTDDEEAAEESLAVANEEESGTNVFLLINDISDWPGWHTRLKIKACIAFVVDSSLRVQVPVRYLNL